jgi:hypothetical protein
MADATTPTTPATVSDNGCGCCRPEPKTIDDIIRELESRRDALDARLAGIGAR